MISETDLHLGKLAVREGLLEPGQLGEASVAAVQAGHGLLEELRERGWLDEAAEARLRDADATGVDPPGSGRGKDTSLRPPADGETDAGDRSPRIPGRPSVGYLVSQSLGLSPEVRLQSAGDSDRAPAPPPAPPAWPEPESEKYEIWGEIASGGMGLIYLAYDRDIHRKVAVKVSRDMHRVNPASVKRFIEEIQATGQLEHPSIVPIYDMGIMADGRPFFVMRYVKGRSLEEILQELRASGRVDDVPAVGGSDASRWGRVRFLSILQQICMAMHFAHEKGVIHRDLKPANVMIGSYGEVQIMDWGLAKVRGRSEILDLAIAAGTTPSVEVGSPEHHPATLQGQIIGTPAYMPPEQAAGRAVEATAASDVYSLGALLYSLLTLLPPIEAESTSAILDCVREGKITPPRQRTPEREIPEVLEEICLRAMAREPEDRYPTAKAMADEVSEYLEGYWERERNHALAERHYAEGMRQAVRFGTLRNDLADLEGEVREARKSVQPWWPIERRKHVFEAMTRLEEARQHLAESYSAATEQLSRSLGYEQEFTPARGALADLYWDRFLEAESSGNVSDQIIYQNLVKRFDDSRYAALIQGDGRLTLRVKAAGAEVFLSAFESDGPAFALGDEGHVGSTPLDSYALPMGSYLVRLVSPGYRETILPLHLSRAASVELSVKLYRDEEIGQGFVYVPGGEVPLGGDPDAYSPRDGFVDDRADFFLGRYPVTVEEYKLFLDALVAAGERDEALRRAPRETSEGGEFWKLESEEMVPVEGTGGRAWGMRYPVSSISWEDATAYCVWLSEQLGKTVALPHDRDWEKAARGADRRFFPWGNLHDYTYANNAHSHEQGGRMVPVGTFPMDRSPYGIMDMAGNVLELCRNSPTPSYAHAAVLKGGSFTSPGLDARAAGRALLDKKKVRAIVGFRVAIYPGGLPSDE